MKDRWIDRVFTGHWNWWRITVYGANAMHWALNLRTRWGWFCAHPTTRTFGGRWPWYVYLSPDGTPSAAYWGFGPGFYDRCASDRSACRARRVDRVEDFS